MRALWTDTYQKHFQRYFQKPFDIQVYHDPHGFALKLATHDWARSGFRVFASMGLADKLARNGEEDFGEVILFSDVPDPEPPQLFVNALFFILHNEIPLGSRFAIGGIKEMKPAFAKRFGKTALYFTRATDETALAPQPRGKDDASNAAEGHFNVVRNGQNIGRVYQAFFITPEEDAYLEDYGPDEFEKKFLLQFSDGTDAEPLGEEPTDAASAEDDLTKLWQKLWQQSSRALSVQRESCV